MNNYKSLAKITLISIHILMVILGILIVILPWGIQWYAETMGRSSKLAAVVMLTCYPCSPFAAYALFSMRRLMINISKGDFFCEKNFKCLNNIGACCFIAGIIMVIAGTQYMPFYIGGGAAIFCSLVIYVCEAVLLAVKPQDNNNTTK